MLYLKSVFGEISDLELSQEICPLILNKIVKLLKEGGESIDTAVELLHKIKFSPVFFKEDFLKFMEGNVSTKPYQGYESIAPVIKSSFTRKLNEHFAKGKAQSKSKKKGKDNETDDEIKEDDEECDTNTDQ